MIYLKMIGLFLLSFLFTTFIFHCAALYVALEKIIWFLVFELYFRYVFSLLFSGVFSNVIHYVKESKFCCFWFRFVLQSQ